MQRDTITIIDFGGQYAHLIANRIRRFGVYTEIVTNDVKASELTSSKGLIFSGGPQSVNTDSSPQVDKAIFDLDIPILGICYGHQMFGFLFGGEIGSVPEYGRCPLFIKNSEDLFLGCELETSIWQNHGDAIVALPKGFEIIASSDQNEIAAMKHSKKPWYSVQFHPEVTHSGAVGTKMLENFALHICQAQPSWSMEVYLEEVKQEILAQVGDRNVFLLVSGGVDSTVCFALLNDILGKERVFGLHIDNGFMRKNESQNVLKVLNEKGFDNLEVAHASDEFFSALEDVYEPETKRKIIGQVYLDVKDAALTKYNLDPNNWLLAQGTIYPDTIESGGTKHSDTIKTHHNRIDQIQILIDQGLVVEPLKELYKDEVRELGRLLGLPDHLVDRHPFPGPGLAIRALCAKESGVSEEYGDDGDSGKYKLFKLPLQSVGIKGDARSYAHPVVAEGGYGFEKLEVLMTKVTSDVEVNRLIYPIVSCVKGRSEMRLCDQYLESKYIDILREADAIVMDALMESGLMKKVWQCPTVIVPFGTSDQPYCIIIRPIDSIDAMSAQAIDLGYDFLLDVSNKILSACPKVCEVFVDITSKPPGTIEWE